jgi:hypothetical protein
MKTFVKKCVTSVMVGTMLAASATTAFAVQIGHDPNGNIRFNGTVSREIEGTKFESWEDDVRQQVIGMGVFSKEQIEMLNNMIEGITWIKLPAPVNIEIDAVSDENDYLNNIIAQTHEQWAGVEIDKTPYIHVWHDEGVRQEAEWGTFTMSFTLTKPGLYTLIAAPQTVGVANNFVIEVTGEGQASAPVPQPAPITVTINNTPVNFADQPPTVVDGRTLVPVRGVFEALGFDVGWNEQARQVTLSRANDTIVITLDSATFTTNSASHTLDVPAQSIGGRTMLPIRAVLESVGYNLGWNEATRTVIITAN